MPDDGEALPDAKEVLPDDKGVLPDDQGALPDDQGALPDVQDALSVDQGAVSVDQGALPDDQGVLPDDQGALHIVQGALPDTKGELPDDQETLPDDQGALPDDEGIGPDENAPAPAAHGVPPRRTAGVAPASGGASSPKPPVRAASRPRSVGQASLPAGSRGIPAPCSRFRHAVRPASERAAGCRPNRQAGSLPHTTGPGGETPPELAGEDACGTKKVEARGIYAASACARPGGCEQRMAFGR